MSGGGEQVEAAETAQTIIRKSPKALSQRDPVIIAEHFFRSGFFPDVKSMSQAVVKIMAGEELGLPPMAAMQGLTMIEGRLGMMANLVATKVKQHEAYNYKILERDNQHCKLAFYDGDEVLGESEFTIQDATTAGLIKPKSNWEKYPRAMCFNRALTEGVRAFIPDVTAGTPVYTTEEIEEVITETPAAGGGGEAETEQPSGGLDPAKLAHLIEGIEIVKPILDESGVNWLDGLNLILGSVGADAFNATDEIDGQLRKLTPEQADQLDTQIQALAEPEEVDAEVVEEAVDAAS